MKYRIYSLFRENFLLATLLLFGLFMLGAAGPAEARKVYSPNVEKGEIEIEYLADVSLDSDPAVDGTAKHQFEFGYGFTDRWFSAITAVYTRTPAQSFRYDRIKWENIYQLFEKGEHWLDAGLYAEYQIPDSNLNKPDVFEFKLLLEKQEGSIRNDANLIFKKELGANAANNTTFSYAWKTRWYFKQAFKPGFEVYGALGELGNTSSLSLQSHMIGPVISGKLLDHFEYEIGYLFGLTRGTADGNLKLILAYEY